MTDCKELHSWAHMLPAYRFPFDDALIPVNGIYILFEKGESAHGGARIVRVGTHTGEHQLLSRLKQHFLTENKDRSIFRKNIGRALLARDADPFLSDWELDLTSRGMRDLHGGRIDTVKQKEIEVLVSQYMRDHFTFAVIPVEDKEERLHLESRLISTVSRCEECKPSTTWLGNSSPKEKIRKSGLWIVNELYKEPLSDADFTALQATML